MKMPPTSYSLQARTVRPGVSTATSHGATVEFDTSAGGSDVLPGPADLMTMAFAACVLKNVERFSQMLSFRCLGASVDVTSERQDVPPKMTRITYRLHLVTDESQHRVDLLHRNIKEHGTIFNTLAAVCEVSGDVTVQQPEAALHGAGSRAE